MLLKKAGLMACSHVGGLSGSFILVSEDIGMIEAAEMGRPSTSANWEAMTAICSVGLDMVAVPGDTPAESLGRHDRRRGGHWHYELQNYSSARHSCPWNGCG